MTSDRTLSNQLSSKKILLWQSSAKTFLADFEHEAHLPKYKHKFATLVRIFF